MTYTLNRVHLVDTLMEHFFERIAPLRHWYLTKLRRVTDITIYKSELSCIQTKALTYSTSFKEILKAKLLFMF